MEVSLENLYKFNADCGRAGRLEGMFMATPEEVKAIIGQHLHFGEVLGKHSDINGKIEEKEITLVTDNRNFLDMAKDIGIDLESGMNPLNYYTCEDCGYILDAVTGNCEECNENSSEEG